MTVASSHQLGKGDDKRVQDPSIFTGNTHSCFWLLCKVLWAWALVHTVLDVPPDVKVRHAKAGASSILHSAQMLTGSTCFWRVRLAVR